MDFTIEDVPFDPAEQLPAAVDRALLVLNALQDGKLLPITALAKRVGVCPGTWHQYCNHPAIKDFKICVPIGGTRKNLYGNAATIKAYRERIAS